MRRIVISVLAGLVVVVSAVALLSWVSNADSRALAGQQPVTVLVASAEIPVGTTAAEARGLVTTKQVPTSAVVPGAIASLDSVMGQVALSTIHAGEQLIAQRWGNPDEAAKSTAIPIPAGYQSVSFQLSPDRLNGGKIAPGNLIGIFITDSVQASGPSGEAQRGTKLVLSKVQVLDVVGGVSVSPAPSDSASAAPVPTQIIMVTVAVTSVEAEKLIWGLEGARVYISLQNDETNTEVPVSPITGDEVFN